MNQGVAYQFWRAVEDRRLELGWTRERLSAETANFTPEGKVIPRSTIDNLRTSTRVPQPRIVNALAGAVGLNRKSASRLAGYPADAPPDDDGLPRVSMAELRETVLRSELPDHEKLKVLELLSNMERGASAPRPLGRAVG